MLHHFPMIYIKVCSVVDQCTNADSRTNMIPLRKQTKTKTSRIITQNPSEGLTSSNYKKQHRASVSYFYLFYFFNQTERDHWTAIRSKSVISTGDMRTGPFSFLNPYFCQQLTICEFVSSHCQSPDFLVFVFVSHCWYALIISQCQNKC